MGVLSNSMGLVFRQRIADFFLGLRPGFGDGRHAIRLAETAALRRRANWVLPGLLGLLVLVLDFLFTTSNIADLGFPYLSVRIIGFDYLIFFFGWVCGWSAAWKWRRNQGFVEELVTTNLRPAVFGNLLFAGGVAAWFRILLVVGLADIVLVMLKLWSQGVSVARGVTFGTEVTVMAYHFPVVVVLHLVLAWFHLESIRIAYWMFATAALPRINLTAKAFSNFFIIIFYVIFLTGIGSAIAGTGGVVLSLLLANRHGGILFESQLMWSLSALFGLVVVGLMKRGLSRLYEHQFTRSFLLFTWWGAGETYQPQRYPPGMMAQLFPWTAFLRMEEDQIAGKKPRPHR